MLSHGSKDKNKLYIILFDPAFILMKFFTFCKRRKENKKESAKGKKKVYKNVIDYK